MKMNTIKKNSRLKYVVLLGLLGSCTVETPGTETGFRELIPGSFNYFKHNTPCSSSGSDGTSCTYEYDKEGRSTVTVCPGQVKFSVLYQDQPVIRTEVIEDLSDTRANQTNVEEYTIENELLRYKKVTTYRDINAPHTTEPTVYEIEYVRDSDNRVIQTQYSGDITGTQFYHYDVETNLLDKVDSDFSGGLFTPSDWQYIWDDEEITEMVMINIPDNLTVGAIRIRYDYDDSGRPLSDEVWNINGAKETTTYSYSCE